MDPSIDEVVERLTKTKSYREIVAQQNSAGDPTNVAKCRVHSIPLRFNGFAWQCPHQDCSWIRMVEENLPGAPWL